MSGRLSAREEGEGEEGEEGEGGSRCDPAFQVVWHRFRHVKRYLAYRSWESYFHVLACAAVGCPGRGFTQWRANFRFVDFRFVGTLVHPPEF